MDRARGVRGEQSYNIVAHVIRRQEPAPVERSVSQGGRGCGQGQGGGGSSLIT